MPCSGGGENTVQSESDEQVRLDSTNLTNASCAACSTSLQVALEPPLSVWALALDPPTARTLGTGIGIICGNDPPAPVLGALSPTWPPQPEASAVRTASKFGARTALVCHAGAHSGPYNPFTATGRPWFVVPPVEWVSALDELPPVEETPLYGRRRASSSRRSRCARTLTRRGLSRYPSKPAALAFSAVNSSE
jgi:hypothetical protein